MKQKLLLLLAAFLTLFSFCNVIMAQAPDLGTAASFVLFSTNGAVSNTGNSHLTGNVGTNNGSNTGFGNVNGVMHSADGATSAAASDLLNAYDQLKSTVATFFPASLLGDGDTLNAGVYSIAANTTLDQMLFLNAKGDSNAVFIIKIAAAFSTTAASKVILINKAKACNVFWTTEGLVSMATGTSMKGTVIANNAAISMSTGVTLEGRALSTTGAVTVSGVLAYTPTGCGSTFLTGPAAPNLASVACYGIFSGNGEVTNSGVSNVTGDIGTNMGLTTGFNPLNVTGMIHPIPDGSTAACAADLLNVYTYLNTLPHDIELLYPAQFGNSLVLTPHTYLLNAATTFIDTLFLNAEGNENAVFVIKINGALTTGTYATVVLTNGTQAKNVYWKVDGAVNINDFSNFKGTVVCNNGAVGLKTGAVLDGRALTTTGSVTTASINSTIPAGTCRVLPVSWLYFRGRALQENVLLEWSTINEMNNGFFTIEKSADGKTFNTLTTVNAATHAGKSEYSFTDQQPYSLGYYRISQTDKNGQRSYSSTIQVSISQSLIVIQYIRGNYIFVNITNATPGNGSMQLYSADGKRIASQKIVLTKEASTYKIMRPLQQGIYLLHVESAGNSLYKGKVMVE